LAVGEQPGGLFEAKPALKPDIRQAKGDPDQLP